MKLTFERSIRNAIYPVIFRRNRESINLEIDDFKFNTSYKRNFNFSINHIMMINIIHDIVKTLWYNEINGGIVPRNINDPIIYNNTENDLTKEKLNRTFNLYLNNPKKNMIINTTYERIMNCYPFINKVIKGPKKMIDIFDQISQSSFNMNLMIRHFNKKNKMARYLKFSTIDKKPTKLFSVKYNSSIDNRGRHSNVSFQLNLNYFYSYVMYQGIKALNIDYIPEQIYTKKISDSSKLFYILFLVGGKLSKEPILLTEIIKRIQLKYTTLKHAEKLIISILEELKNNNIIRSFRITNGSILYRRFIIKQENIKWMNEF